MFAEKLKVLDQFFSIPRWGKGDRGERWMRCFIKIPFFA